MDRESCQEPDCGRALRIWRACAVKGCSHNTAFCSDHGGDDRAQKEMHGHIEAHAARGEEPDVPRPL
jgi:hypothetical protein